MYRHEGLRPGSDEDTPCRPPLRDTGDLAAGNYGRLKVACEDDVTARDSVITGESLAHEQDYAKESVPPERKA